ncbi:MAG: bifunctional hydroxymethylpyrimidine kinase/phosphomethylpyrimidine kinase [Clostridiales bacterium]|jgi:hydroxymethylpyrimidine/phosphomethylpyrimidine kinase|nr:bifunctional hydroxymethylpyrimidine kinase/phosphomethylpyrimidine kinase [Clostridiales bacterium]
MKKVLTIAGSDSSGGAGIQADIKTVTAYGMYAMSVITALTAQNTTGVYGIHETPPDFVALQIDCVFKDIFPDAVKIGMLSNPKTIDAVAVKLQEYAAKNIVLDPVMISTSGSRLLSADGEKALYKLFALSSLITPNIPEAQALCGVVIKDKADMERAAKLLSAQAHRPVLLKGGHLTDGEAADCLCDNGSLQWFFSPRIDNPNTHGTGCTLSSAIACGLAGGNTLSQSIQAAKLYLTEALESRLNIGQGKGPVNHMYNIPNKIIPK